MSSIFNYCLKMQKKISNRLKMLKKLSNYLKNAKNCNKNSENAKKLWKLLFGHFSIFQTEYPLDFKKISLPAGQSLKK